jgi:hypothetical protein
LNDIRFKDKIRERSQGFLNGLDMVMQKCNPSIRVTIQGNNVKGIAVAVAEM